MKPLINGTLNSRHGKYQEFGKLLKIKKGEVKFDGPIPPSPYINIIGAYNVNNSEIRVILSGPIESPEVTIESTPEMQQEEALSMLLFGKTLNNISTLQALRIADSVRRLSGYGGRFDFLGLYKNILGVDNVDIQEDPDNPKNAIIRMGKYLSDKVYLEIQRKRQDGSNATKIDVQIGPKLSVEYIDQKEGDSSFGVNWRFDY